MTAFFSSVVAIKVVHMVWCKLSMQWGGVQYVNVGEVMCGYGTGDV